MILFALSCFGILFYLWTTFGGSIPFKPQGYRFNAAFPDATNLVSQADIRIAGVNVGKVQNKWLAPGGRTTMVQLQLDDKYAPIPTDTHAILRQKTLLGETYVQLTPGTPSAPKLKEGSTLPNSQVEPTVGLDQILAIFDPKTRDAFRAWQQQGAQAINGEGQNLNDALGNFPNFVDSGTNLLAVLDQQNQAVTHLIHNTGVVFGALNQRQGELADLIQNSNNLWSAVGQENKALSDTIDIFPTFLDEARSTNARLQSFSINTQPLVDDLKPVADNLGPTLQDLGALSPDLRTLFSNLHPLINESGQTLPAGARTLHGLPPVLQGFNNFLPQLNPIVSYLGFQQPAVSDFISVGASGLNASLPPLNPGGEKRHYLRQFAIIDGHSLDLNQQRPQWDRGNAYLAPNAYARARAFGITESFDCAPTGGTKPNPSGSPQNGTDSPPCFVAPPSLWDFKKFPRLNPGEAPLVLPPQGNAGAGPAHP